MVVPVVGIQAVGGNRAIRLVNAESLLDIDAALIVIGVGRMSPQER